MKTTKNLETLDTLDTIRKVFNNQNRPLRETFKKVSKGI